jgi:hypothetical protein
MIGLLQAFISGGGLGAISKAADKYFDNEAEKEAFQNAVELELLKNQKSIDNAGADIIKAEINNGGLASQWRPLLMLVIIAIVAYHYLIYPLIIAFYPSMPFLELPSELWNLLQIGVGGYVIGRSGEKVAKELGKK